MQKRVNFTNRSDLELAGILHQPDTGIIKGWALFAHCFTCSKNIHAATNIAKAMTAEGIAVLRFDFTGLGASEGEFENTHFSSNIDDLVDAAKWMGSEYEAPDLLVGHSLGGTAVLAAASQIESAKAVVTIGSPADADHVLNLLADNIDEIESEGVANIKLSGRSFKIKQSFLDDVREQKVKENLKGLKKALLVMHSPIDEQVSIDQAADLFVNAMHPKSFISLDQADHLLTDKKDSLEAGRLLSAWAIKYLPTQDREPSWPKSDGNAVVAHLDRDNGFLTTVNAAGHPVIVDEPVSVGGTDRGPTPYGYLSAGLGACTAMTMMMYANRKKWDLASVKVVTNHDKIHVDECEDCETESGKVDHFERVISVNGDLSTDQREKLIEIADKCPVHRSLHHEVKVTTKLVE